MIVDFAELCVSLLLISVNAAKAEALHIDFMQNTSRRQENYDQQL